MVSPILSQMLILPCLCHVTAVLQHMIWLQKRFRIPDTCSRAFPPSLPADTPPLGPRHFVAVGGTEDDPSGGVCLPPPQGHVGLLSDPRAQMCLALSTEPLGRR